MQKQVEALPTQVEVPASNTDPTKVGEKETAPAQFPGAKEPAAVEPEKTAPTTDKQETQPPASQTNEPATAPAHGQ